MRAKVDVAKGGISQHFITRNVLVPGQSIEMQLEEGPFSQLHGLWVFAVGGKGLQDQPRSVVRVLRVVGSCDLGAVVQSGGQHTGRCILSASQELNGQRRC